MIRFRVPTARRRLTPLFGSPTTAPLPTTIPPTSGWTIINPKSFGSGNSSQLSGRHSHHSDCRYSRLSSSRPVSHTLRRPVMMPRAASGPPATPITARRPITGVRRNHPAGCDAGVNRLRGFSFPGLCAEHRGPAEQTITGRDERTGLRLAGCAAVERGTQQGVAHPQGQRVTRPAQSLQLALDPGVAGVPGVPGWPAPWWMPAACRGCCSARRRPAPSPAPAARSGPAGRARRWPARSRPTRRTGW
jgi:hypothetical protein